MMRATGYRVLTCATDSGLAAAALRKAAMGFTACRRVQCARTPSSRERLGAATDATRGVSDRIVFAFRSCFAQAQLAYLPGHGPGGRGRLGAALWASEVVARGLQSARCSC